MLFRRPYKQHVRSYKANKRQENNKSRSLNTSVYLFNKETEKSWKFLSIAKCCGVSEPIMLWCIFICVTLNTKYLR